MCPTEQRYCQIEKECLAICNCFHEFDQWLYGKCGIDVHTDHQPLETIMKKPLNKVPARLQMKLMRLQRYWFNLTYKRGPTLHLADTFLGSPSTANISKSNTLLCLPNGDGVQWAKTLDWKKALRTNCAKRQAKTSHWQPHTKSLFTDGRKTDWSPLNPYIPAGCTETNCQCRMVWYTKARKSWSND